LGVREREKRGKKESDELPKNDAVCVENLERFGKEKKKPGLYGGAFGIEPVVFFFGLNNSWV
jgi:hypothetical protein